MALVSAVLQSKLENIFSQMSLGGKDDNWLATQLATEVANYIRQAQFITSSDVGMASGVVPGTYTGVTSGTVSVQKTPLENILKTTFASMKSMSSGGDSYMASQFATGLTSMMLTIKFTATSTGTAMQTAGTSVVPIPWSCGSMNGVFTGIPAPVIATLNAAFATMKNMPNGGDKYLAQQIAQAVTTYYQTGTIVTTLTGMVNGSGAGGKLL